MRQPEGCRVQDAGSTSQLVFSVMSDEGQDWNHSCWRDSHFSEGVDGYRYGWVQDLKDHMVSSEDLVVNITRKSCERSSCQRGIQFSVLCSLSNRTAKCPFEGIGSKWSRKVFFFSSSPWNSLLGPEKWFQLFLLLVYTSWSLHLSHYPQDPMTMSTPALLWNSARTGEVSLEVLQSGL